MSSDYGLLGSLLEGAGFVVWSPADRGGIMAEDEARLVWARVFTAPDELLRSWQDEQTWFVDFVGDRVSFDKSWELYLVLASELPPSAGELNALIDIRADTAFTRKVVVPGLETASPARVRDYLAVLRPLSLDVTVGKPDPFSSLEEQARQQGRDDIIETLVRYRANQPLFGGED